jgi:hypothetical protein
MMIRANREATNRIFHSRVHTWQLFLGLASAKLMLTTYYDTVLLHATRGQIPPEVLKLISRQQFFLVHYGVTLLTFLIAITFVACLTQLVLLALRYDYPFTELFRAVLIASGVLILESTTRALIIFEHSRALTDFVVREAPLSLAALSFWPSTGSALFNLLNAVSVFEVAWCVLLCALLARRVPRRTATTAVIAVWTFLTLFQWVIVSFGPRLFA